MCRGKVDQWTGVQDSSGALVSTGQLWSVGIIRILRPHLTSPLPCQQYRIIIYNSKLNNIKIWAANAMYHSFLNIMLNDCIHTLHITTSNMI